MPDWKTTWQNSTVVRAVINGTRSATPHTSAHAFYHVYDFIDFQPGPPDPSNFQLPDGYYCQGLKGENKTVPQVPSAFSLEFEIVTGVSSRNSNWNHTVSIWKVGAKGDTLRLLHCHHHCSFFPKEASSLPLAEHLYRVPDPKGFSIKQQKIEESNQLLEEWVSLENFQFTAKMLVS